MWRMKGSSTGQAACSLLGRRSRSSGGGTFGRISCIERQPRRSIPDHHRLSKGFERGLGEAESSPGLGDWRSGEGCSLKAGVGAPF